MSIWGFVRGGRGKGYGLDYARPPALDFARPLSFDFARPPLLDYARAPIPYVVDYELRIGAGVTY